MYRFFVEQSQIKDSKIFISGSDAHHIKDVLRMKIGDKIYVSCGDEWEYECEITAFDCGRVETIITDAQKSARELPSKITLYQCLPKKDKMEQIIQKSVELGVYKIVPVMSHRCVVRVEAKKVEARLKRWNAISSAAAKQSKRLIVPAVAPVVSFEEAVSLVASDDVSLIPYEKEESMKATKQLLGNIISGQSIGFIIGPEGGFDESEVSLAIKSGISPISLGRRILRTETAGCALLSVLAFMLESE